MRNKYIVEDLSDIRTLQDPNRSGSKEYPQIGPIEIDLANLRLRPDDARVDLGLFTFKTFVERLAQHAQIKVKIT